MKLIVGLGNPGKEYRNTRHNVGFMIVDHYLNKVTWKEKFEGLYCEKIINDEKIVFLKPQTFMNLSGISVKKALDYYKLNIEDILIIQDDLDIELGHYKLKRNSSSGGHNGINSIISSLNTDSFLRLKIGISKTRLISTTDYVIGKFSSTEIEILNSLMDEFDDVITSFINNGIEKTIQIYNKK